MRKEKKKMENDEIVELIKLIEPKVLKSLSNTKFQERDDLKQELDLKMVQTLKQGSINKVMGFWDLKKQI